MTTTVEDSVPRKEGICEWCTAGTTIYGYALWVCRRCLTAEEQQ